MRCLAVVLLPALRAPHPVAGLFHCLAALDDYYSLPGMDGDGDNGATLQLRGHARKLLMASTNPAQYNADNGQRYGHQVKYLRKQELPKPVKMKHHKKTYKMKRYQKLLPMIALMIGVSAAAAPHFKKPVDPAWRYVSGAVTQGNSYSPGNPGCPAGNNICKIIAPEDPANLGHPLISPSLASRITNKDTNAGDVFLKN